MGYGRWCGMAGSVCVFSSPLTDCFNNWTTAWMTSWITHQLFLYSTYRNASALWKYLRSEHKRRRAKLPQSLTWHYSLLSGRNRGKNSQQWAADYLLKSTLVTKCNFLHKACKTFLIWMGSVLELPPPAVLIWKAANIKVLIRHGLHWVEFLALLWHRGQRCQLFYRSQWQGLGSFSTTLFAPPSE